METPYLLHIFNPTRNVSPFDVNMAYEANYNAVIPYSEVTLDDIHTLTQDTIFSRGPLGTKRTGIFIGGRTFGLAIDMLNRAKAAMVPPFEISVFADPSGAITTAATIIACIEVWAEKQTGHLLEGKTIHIIGGTGPVGVCAGIIADNCGAKVHLMSHRGLDVAQEFAEENNGKFNVSMQGADGSSNEAIARILHTTDIVISSAKAGVQVLSKAQLMQADKLIIAADANAVPPLGIEGVGLHDLGKVLDFTPNKAVGLGALAMGDIKYKVHCRMFQMMREADKPLYLDHHEAFKVARAYAAR